MNSPSKNKLTFDHAAIWVEDMEKTVSFLTDIVGWRRHPMVVEVSADDPTVGGMHAVFVDANGLWLEMILPTSEGPGMDILRQVGDGAIVEINFEAEDYEATLESMRARGITMLAMDGSPIGEDGGRIDEGVAGVEGTHETGQRIAYWPTDISRGTTVEIYEVLKGDETNLLYIRDQQWSEEYKNPTGPRISHVSIVVADLEKSASFYTDVMGLRRHSAEFEIDASANEGVGGMKACFIDTNGVYLELFQPTGEGPLNDLLETKGDGYIAELIAEVDDIALYFDQVKAKGIHLAGLDGQPLDEDAKCILIQPHGDKIAYFPSAVSCGLTIEVVERGPKETSILHKLHG